MPVDITWSDGWLRAAVRSAFPVAVVATAAEARSRARWRHVASSVFPIIAGMTGGIGVRSPDWKWLEFGTRPHGEEPVRKLAMKFPNGGFAKGAVPHPGTSAEPFLRPTLPSFPEKYRQAARIRVPG